MVTLLFHSVIDTLLILTSVECMCRWIRYQRQKPKGA